MSEQLVFYVVFLGQVLMISYFLPKRVLRLMGHVMSTYPPAEYPRLYPKPIAFYERSRRVYRNLNRVALAVGLALVAAWLIWRSEAVVSWDNDSVLTFYMALQFSPLLVAFASGFVYFSPRRRLDASSTRRAELRPRRLFDFVSPTMVAVAVAVYLGFAALVAYLTRVPFPGFAGYWNILYVTIGNLILATVIYRVIYGKKKDPYQGPEARRREIEFTVKVAVFTSIVATCFIAISLVLSAFDLKSLKPISLSLYFQLMSLVSFRSFSIDHVDFEVYRAEPQEA